MLTGLVIGIIIGLLVGWNLLPQPAWVVSIWTWIKGKFSGGGDSANTA